MAFDSLLSAASAASALGPAEQDHLLQARQMQALSFAVHIPLTCFAMSFPSMVRSPSGCTGGPGIPSTGPWRGAGRR
jgi:hypothetical protein